MRVFEDSLNRWVPPSVSNQLSPFQKSGWSLLSGFSSHFPIGSIKGQSLCHRCSHWISSCHSTERSKGNGGYVKRIELISIFPFKNGSIFNGLLAGVALFHNFVRRNNGSPLNDQSIGFTCRNSRGASIGNGSFYPRITRSNEWRETLCGRRWIEKDYGEGEHKSGKNEPLIRLDQLREISVIHCQMKKEELMKRWEKKESRE